MTSTLEQMSQSELLAQLNRLMRERQDSGDGVGRDIAWAMHELQVHQVELEMQNRELRDAHAAAEVARDRFRTLYDFAPVGICSLDRDMRIIELNLTAARMLGVERVLCAAQTFDALCPSLKQNAFGPLRALRIAA